MTIMKKRIILTVLATAASLIASVFIFHACNKAPKADEGRPALIKNGFVWKVTDYLLITPVESGKGKKVFYEYMDEGLKLNYLIFSDKWLEQDGYCQLVAYDDFKDRFNFTTIVSEQEPVESVGWPPYSITFKNAKKSIPLLEGKWECVHLNDNTLKLTNHSGTEHADRYEYIRIVFDSQL